MHSAAIAFLLAGSAILLFIDKYSNLLSRSNEQFSEASDEEDSDGLGFEELKHLEERIESFSPGPPQKPTHLVFILASAILLTSRVELFHFLHKEDHTLCKNGLDGYAYMPLVLLVLEWWHQRRQGANKDILGWFMEVLFLGIPIMGVLAAHSLATFLWSRPASSFICGELPYPWHLRSLVMAIDGTILLIAKNQFRAASRENIKRSLDAVGTTFLTTAMFVTILAARVDSQRSIPIYTYLVSLLKCTFPGAATAYYGSQLLVEAEAFDLASLMFFISTCTMLISTALEAALYPLPKIWLPLLLATTSLHASGFSRIRFKTSWPRSSNRLACQVHLKQQLLLGILDLLLIFLSFSSTPTFEIHPIQALIRDASQKHEAFVRQASPSKSLKEATQEYKRRYRRSPPPGFNIWYNFATERNSLIIDDFDGMSRDLAPFWALSPSEIRRLTREITAKPWNDIAKLSIRNGSTEVGEMPGTHRWMIDGAASMIQKFSMFLPDMDLAFNLNDEPRCAIPYHQLHEYQSIASQESTILSDKQLENTWTTERADSWNFDSSGSHFLENSVHNSFSNFGSISCPPSSPARSGRVLHEGRVCFNCLAPHSLGGFVQNWTLAGSPCHQPDLKSLHGFYLSPASFKASSELLPVFSQGKPQGFADILYPSPWNYMDKANYSPSEEHPDVPFTEKQNTLFWRGATSEGLSTNHENTWRGMVRQRLVHLASSPPSSVPVLLPQSGSPSQYTIQYPSPSIFTHSNVTIDAAIVSNIVRCGEDECREQKAALPVVEPTDFQDHWKYRYLMDMDGAGFSGRFLPFLQSKSLPFKTALFREWYDGRIQAWKHFVPIDLRLHDLWSVLLWFGGHTDEGEMIAREGRDWVGQVLRKEDMEVYLFRLLLEWGRLTDDRRNEIGYVWKDS